MSTDCTCFRKSSARKKNVRNKISRLIHPSFISRKNHALSLCSGVNGKKNQAGTNARHGIGAFPLLARNETTQYFRLPFLPSLSYQTGAVARKQVQCTELTAANKMLKNPLSFVPSHFTKQKKKHILNFFTRALPGNSRVESWKLRIKISHLLMPYCKVWRKRALRCQNSPERTSVASIARYRRRISPCSSLRDTGE